MMVFLQTVMKAAWGQAEILGWEDVMYPVGLDNGLGDMWAVPYAGPDVGQRNKPWMHYKRRS